MADALITHFEPDPERLAVIRECMDNHGVGTPEAEWPNNIISRRAVVYGSGVIHRQGAPIRHEVDPDELALCHRLAAEATEQIGGVDVGMRSESCDPFRGFFIAANGSPHPAGINEALIRSRFGDTLFPPVSITVEPLAEHGIWWAEVKADGDDSEDGMDGCEAKGGESESEADYLAPWRAMIQWFRERSEFVDLAFIRVGNARTLWDLPEEQWPNGTELTGCVFPRLALGLTRGGSLVGLFGYCVQT